MRNTLKTPAEVRSHPKPALLNVADAFLNLFTEINKSIMQKDIKEELKNHCQLTVHIYVKIACYFLAFLKYRLKTTPCKKCTKKKSTSESKISRLECVISNFITERFFSEGTPRSTLACFDFNTSSV